MRAGTRSDPPIRRCRRRPVYRQRSANEQVPVAVLLRVRDTDHTGSNEVCVGDEIRFELLEHRIRVAILSCSAPRESTARGTADHEVDAARGEIGQLRAVAWVVRIRGRRGCAAGDAVVIAATEHTPVPGPQGVGVAVPCGTVPQAYDDGQVRFVQAVPRLAAVEQILSEADGVRYAARRCCVEDDAVLAGTIGEPVILSVASWSEGRRLRLRDGGASSQSDGGRSCSEARDQVPASTCTLCHVSSPGRARPPSRAQVGALYAHRFEDRTRTPAGLITRFEAGFNLSETSSFAMSIVVDVTTTLRLAQTQELRRE